MKKLCALLVSVGLTLSSTFAAGFFYATPSGGWNYLYDGDQTNGLGTCKPSSALDGTWSANNGSSEFDGSWRGAGNGAAGGISSDGTFITLEDIDNSGGSCNNRKVYFTHDMAQDSGLVNPGTIVDTGVTITFRTRLPSSDPLAEISLPNGWGIFSSGKANFNVHQYDGANHRIIGFSLVRQTEDGNGGAILNFPSAGLTMNRLNGDSPSGTVDSTGTASQNQVLALDPTQWHEFWVTIQANDATPGNGTHTVKIYVDGAATPVSFNVTAGTGSDNTQNYIGMGLNNSTGAGCFDADFFGYKQGIFTPVFANPPSAPTNVVAVPGDGEVSLSWDAAFGATGYIVKASTMSGGPYADIASVSGTSYTDTPVINGTTYYYIIEATNNAGGTASDEVSATPNVAVTGVTATGGTNEILVQWNLLPTATSYSVLRADTSGGPYTTIATGLTTTEYLDSSLPDGTTFYYRVDAELAGGGQSTPSNEASSTTAPAVPTLTASLFASTVAKLDWTTSDPDVGQFIIESATDGMTFSQVATASGSARSAIITGLSLDSTNTFRIKATTDGGESDYSNEAVVITPVFGVNVNFANASFSTNFPGYVNDYGTVYADRGNGYFYGWSADNTDSARQRNSGNSPDKRYDTLNHMQRNGAFGWEIAIPNGFYQVHIVAGDPDNQDSVYQFDVEGVVTDTYTPSSANRFHDFTVTVAINDGGLTLTNGPSAANNKIAFIDIMSAVPVAPVIATDPQSQTVEETHPVSLSVTLSEGSTPLVYEWYHDNMLVTGATGPTLSIAHVQASDAGDYFVVVTNYGGMATSATATLTVNPDTNAPAVLSAGSLDGNTIGLCFNEEVDPTTAQNPANYTVNSGTSTVTNAVLRADSQSVRLFLDTTVNGTFTVDVAGVEDLSMNAISASVTQSVAGLTVGDVGAPSLSGSSFTCDNETIEIVGGGSDIWGSSDNFYFASREVTGDFDASVRLTNLVGANAITKAVIAARESRNADAAAFHISVNPPPPGRDQVELGLRSTTGGSTASWGETFVPAGIPDTWIRITRVGDTFTGYRSTNGVDWIPMGTNTLALSSSLQVGIGVTAHDDALLATGTFSDLVIIDSPELIDPVYAGGTFSASFAAQDGVSYEVQYKDSLDDPMWTTLTTLAGDGTVLSFTDNGPLPPMRFYRIIAQ